MFYDLFAWACTETKISRLFLDEKMTYRYIFRLCILFFKFFFGAFPSSPFLIFLLQWLTFYWACFQCEKFWESIKVAPCSINSIHISRSLRGPAPKKRPMTSSSKIESADFYLSSRGYWILFKNEFLLFQFHFKPKISSRKLFPSDSSKIRPKRSPRKKW